MKKDDKEQFRYDEWLNRLFCMDDAVWMRHASPWSVWTRAVTLPLLLVAIWSHTWIGMTGAIVSVVLVGLWAWLNPRLFTPPSRTDTWPARATFGERVWLNRQRVAIPRHHAVAAHLLSGITATGAVIAIWGAATSALWPALLGTAVTMLGKFWFLDRMVWLYLDMKNADPIYRSWERAPVNDNANPGKRRKRSADRPPGKRSRKHR